jgi:Tetratricopeptide repeat
VNTFTSPAAANAAGIALRSEGKLAEAIAAFRDAVLQFPQIPALHQNLAQTLYEAGDTAEAVAEHRRVLAMEPRNVGSHLALYELLQMTGDPVLARAHQRLALEEQRLFSHAAPRETRSILFLMAPGDWQANIPVDFLFDRQTTSVHKLYLLDEAHLHKDSVPRYDVMWNAIAESPDALPYLDLASRIMSAQDKPVLNDPRSVVATSRLRLPDTLRGTGAHVPHVKEVRFDDLANATPGMEFPVIARPAGSHAGSGLELLRTTEDCRSYVNAHEASTYYVSGFVDYSNDDGFFRKYRIVFVDGAPYPVHLAISKNWMIHYYNAPMAENQWMRDEEARFLEDLPSAFGGERGDTLRQIAKAVGLEYFGIDCSIDRDGRVLVFEADPAMLVHSSDPPELYPYKRQFVPRIYRAIEAMVDRRKAADT